MESIAVTKPDMGVLQGKHLILSPFGALAQAFSDELLARNGFEEGQWPFVSLEFLREEEPGSLRTPVSPSMKVELNLILQALRKTESRTRQERTIERIVERIIRIREQGQAKRSAPPGSSAKPGQPDRPRPAAAGGQNADLKIPVQTRTVNRMSAHHQSFYNTVNQHIHFTANLRQALSVNQTGRPIRSDAGMSGMRSATFTRRIYGNREYGRTVFAPPGQGTRQTGDMPPEGLIRPVTASASAAPAKGGLTSMPDREVTRIAHQITSDLTAITHAADPATRPARITALRTDAGSSHAAPSSESRVEAQRAAAENRAGIPQTIQGDPGAARQTPLEHPSDEKDTGSVINVWNMFQSTRWLQALRRRRQHGYGTARGMTAEGGKERPQDTAQDIRRQTAARRENAGLPPESSARMPPELTYLPPREEPGGEADRAGQDTRKSRSDTAREGPGNIRRAGGADRSSAREAARASRTEGQRTPDGSGTGAQHTPAGRRPAERKRTTESGTRTGRAAAESDSGGRGAAVRSQPARADGHDQTQNGRTARQEKTDPKPGSGARVRLLTSTVRDIRTAGAERAAFEDGAERTQRFGYADGRTPGSFMRDDETPGPLLTFAENARRADGQPGRRHKGGAYAPGLAPAGLTAAAALRDIRLVRAERKAETAPGGQLDAAPARPPGSGPPGQADRIPGYGFADGLHGFPDAPAGMPELAFAQQGKNADADPGARGHGYEVHQGRDNTGALPDWARRFLYDGGAQDWTETAERMRSARSIAALPTQTRQEEISWTAPDYRPPMPIAFKERSEPRQVQQPVSARISDAEIRRTADKVYRIIEDRIRRERRRLGL